MSDPATYKPVCFMVMPFGRKPVLPQPAGAPASIDFDALWNRVFAPLIQELGYEPVRADQDAGASIILEMLERLYFSDMVVADMTLPNGNVYYEVGIRHACRPTHCVLIGAAWSSPLFDANQMRRLVYPLPEGDITDETAAAISDTLRRGARALAEGRSPMYQMIQGFPDETLIDRQRATVIRAQMSTLSAFQGRVRSIRLERDRARQAALALQLRDDCPAGSNVSTAVAMEVLTLLRDVGDWAATIAYADALPQNMRALGFVQEQRSLALSQAGDHLQAIAALEELIERSGPSAERHGLIGGRYKKLWRQAEQQADTAAARDWLDRAIEHYALGMQCDLNDYYPSANLPRLYRARGGDGDEARAQASAHVALAACERARARPGGDEWLNATLLGLAFDAGDAARARALAQDVRREGPAAWKLQTTLADLERAVGLQPDDGVRAALRKVLDELRGLLPPAS